MARFSPYWLWILLSLPAFGFAAGIASSTDPKIYHELLHPTGEFSARFLIIAMLASPLAVHFDFWTTEKTVKYMNLCINMKL